MTRGNSNRAAVLFAMIGLMTYWLMAAVVPAAQLRELFNALSFGVAIMVMVTWAPAAYHAFTVGAHEGEWQLVIAVFLAFAVLAFQRLYAIVMFTLDDPEWILKSYIPGFIAYSVMLVGMLFLVAPSVHNASPGKRYWVHIIWGVAIGALFAGIMIGRSEMVP